MAATFFLAMLAALFFSMQSVANKFLVRPLGLGALPATMLTQALAGLVALSVIMVQGIAWLPALTDYMIASTLLATVAVTLMMFAYARDDASVVAPILGLKVLFVALLESAFFGTPFCTRIWAGALLSMLGIIFISQRDQWSLHLRDLLRPGVLLMAGTALAFSISDLLVAKAITLWHGNSWAVSLYLLVFIAVLSSAGLFALPTLRHGLRACNVDCALSTPGLRASAWPLTLSVIGIFLGQYFFFRAISESGMVTIANIAINMRGLIVVLLMLFIVRGRSNTIEQAGWRAYLYRGIGAVLTALAMIMALA